MFEKEKIPMTMWVSAFLVSLQSFLFGYVIAALNASLVTGDGDSASACYHDTDDSSDGCPPGTLYNDVRMTTTEASLATSLMIIGAWAGCLVGGPSGERYGRRATIMINNVFFLVGGLMCCFFNKYSIFFGRMLAGFGVGVESVVVPVLLSEIASASTRGTITTLHQLQITFGIFICGLVGYGFVTYVTHGWVYIQAGIMIPAVLTILGARWVPESPKWLVHQNRKDEAREVLQSLRHSGADLEEELTAMEEEVSSEDSSAPVTWAEVFACKRAMIIGCGLMTCAAATGINSVMFYSSAIFGFAGFDEAILATASVGAVNLVTTAVSAYLVDHSGRKVLLEVGTTFMTIALACLAIFLLSLNSLQTVQGILAVLAVLLFVIGFAVGLGAVSWVVLSEVMSQRLRSKAFGLFVSINWGINLVIGLLTLLAIDGLGGTKDSMDDDEKDDAQKRGVAYLYLIFGILCLLSLLFIMKYVPETKGKTPEDFADREIQNTSNPLVSSVEL